MNRLLTVFSVAASLALAGCPEPTTCFGTIGVGKRFRVALDSAYNSTTPLYSADLDNTQEGSCGALDGLASGTSFTFWTSRRVDTEPCEAYDGLIRPDSQDVPGVTISPQKPLATNAQKLASTLVRSTQGGFLAQTATGCMGSWSFNIKYTPQGGNFFMAASLDGPPALLLERSFVPAAEPAGICMRCSDTFVVHLERL